MADKLDELGAILEAVWGGALDVTTSDDFKTNGELDEEKYQTAKENIKKHYTRQIEDFYRNKILEARMAELKQLEPPEQWEEFAKLSGSEHCTICGFNAIKFRHYIQERIDDITAQSNSKEAI